MGLFGSIGRLFFGESGKDRKAQIESDLAGLARARASARVEFDWAKNGLMSESWYDRKITIDKISKSNMEQAKKVGYLRFASADPHWLNRKAVLSSVKGMRGRDVEALLDDMASGDSNVNIRRDAKKALSAMRRE